MPLNYRVGGGIIHTHITKLTQNKSPRTTKLTSSGGIIKGVIARKKPLQYRVTGVWGRRKARIAYGSRADKRHRAPSFK